MRVIYGFGKKIDGLSHRPYASLGVFDGVHLGHCYILSSLVHCAHSRRRKAVCVTFFPHPRKILSSRHIFAHLTSLPHRLDLIAETGVDICLVISFNRRFSRISPQDFLRRLVYIANPEKIFVGSNFNFGHGGAGDVSLLKALGK
ncbi:MAG: cytidyltransferase, partial [Candidatus Omnitrophota bacterium]